MEAAKADEVVCAISDDITHREAAQAEDLTRLKAAVEELGQREKFEKKWVVEMLLQLVEPNGQLTAVDVLKQILDSTETIQINASNAKMGEILKLFSLKEAKQIWTLPSNEEHDVPNFVFQMIQEFEIANYDMDNEAACRTRAEYLIVPAIAQARRNAPMKRQRTDSGYTTPSSPSSPSGLQTPRKSKDEYQPQELVISPEMELKVELSHPITKKPYVVTGKADWAAGYDTRSTVSDGTVLICVEAKNACTFSHAASQLITYMAMSRHTRRQKINSNIQGFATDGRLFQFSCIDNAGLLHSSKVLDTKDPKELKTAYNWIVSQLEVAIFSSPTTTPLKGDKLERMADARNYENGIFAQRFSRIEPPKIYFSDEPGDQPDLKLKKRSIF